MSFVVEIATRKEPRLTRTVPVFKTRREAEHYAEHLCRKFADIVTEFRVDESRGRATAEWPKGARAYRWLGKEERGI